MPYIRKVRSGRAIHLGASSCTTTRCRCRVRELRVFRSHPGGPRGCSMQDPASEVPRIQLPRTSVNKHKKKGRGCYYAPALCSHMKDLAFWDALPTSLLLVTWRCAVGVVPEPTILELVAFVPRMCGHIDVGVRCAATILAPPLGESWRGSHRRNGHHDDY